MNDRISGTIYFGVLLAMMIAILAARRVPLKASAKMALAWVGIFVVALVLVSGRHQYAAMWSSARAFLGDGEQSVTGTALSVPMADDGHFYVQATINGVATRMLVDSGATSTMISAETARAAKVNIEESPFPVLLNTAGGPITARVSTIHQLQVGSIHVDDLPTFISPTMGDTNAVGMNFLSKLKSWHVEGRTLVLQPKP
jgi:aspartyl protease family protein